VSGRVLYFETMSLGLLAQLSYEEVLSKEQGSVVKLFYCDRDEIVVAAFSGGALKIFCGCHRSSDNNMKEKSSLFNGGHTPTNPFLLRVNYMIHESTILSMAVSEDLGIIAVSAIDGTVRIVDYYTLHIRYYKLFILIVVLINLYIF
jgi:hypothetical protein